MDLGIPLAWGGIPRLVREIGPALTKELVMTCRQFTPAEARAAGLVNRVVPATMLEKEVATLAAELAAKAAAGVSEPSELRGKPDFGPGLYIWTGGAKLTKVPGP